MLHSFIFSGAPNEYTIYMNMHTRNPYFLVIFKTPSAFLLLLRFSRGQVSRRRRIIAPHGVRGVRVIFIALRNENEISDAPLSRADEICMSVLTFELVLIVEPLITLIFRERASPPPPPRMARGEEERDGANKNCSCQFFRLSFLILALPSK